MIGIRQIVVTNEIAAGKNELSNLLLIMTLSLVRQNEYTYAITTADCMPKTIEMLKHIVTTTSDFNCEIVH